MDNNKILIIIIHQL